MFPKIFGTIKIIMKINYENEIKIENDGQPHHDLCISRCLAYAFGICTDLHETICSNCNEFWILLFLCKKTS